MLMKQAKGDTHESHHANAPHRSHPPQPHPRPPPLPPPAPAPHRWERDEEMAFLAPRYPVALVRRLSEGSRKALGGLSEGSRRCLGRLSEGSRRCLEQHRDVVHAKGKAKGKLDEGERLITGGQL